MRGLVNSGTAGGLLRVPADRIGGDDRGDAGGQPHPASGQRGWSEPAGSSGRGGVWRGERTGVGSGVTNGSDCISADGAVGAGVEIFSLFASRLACCILRHAATTEAPTGRGSGPDQAHNTELDQLRHFVAHCQLSQKKETERVKRELDNLVPPDARRRHKAYADAVREFKKRFLLEVLVRHRGNQCKAAEELGMHRNTLEPNAGGSWTLDSAQIRRGIRRLPRSVRPADAAWPPGCRRTLTPTGGLIRLNRRNMRLTSLCRCFRRGPSLLPVCGTMLLVLAGVTAWAQTPADTPASAPAGNRKSQLPRRLTPGR